MRPAPFNIGSRAIGPGAACFVAAEVGGTHEGSVDEALRLIDAAFQAGADGILFQIYATSRLVVQRHPDRRTLEKRELSPKAWSRILHAAAASGLAVLAEPLDAVSVDVAVEGGAEALLLLADASEDPLVLRGAVASGRPLLLGSRGGEALRTLAAAEARPFAVVVGPADAPAALEELELSEIGTWRERLRLAVGFLDRSDGGSGFALAIPALAVAHGADLVIKGLGRDRGLGGHDHPAALSLEDFHRMVEWLRLAERAEGGELGRSPRKSTTDATRCAVASGLIPRGSVLSAGLVEFKRADARFGGGFGPRELERMIGRRAARPIQADEIIREEMLE